MAARAAFYGALALAVIGTLIAIGALGAQQRFCFDNEGRNGVTNCSKYLSFYWAATALQAFLLISIGAAAAARAVHTYRSSLWTQGVVAVCLSIAQGSNAFRTIFMAGLPSDAHDRWCAYVAGVSCYVAADFILAWAGDTRYRTARVEGKDGFVTFKRLPANWQAQLEQRAAPAEPAEPAKAGPLHYGFLAALGLAVAGACVALGGTAAVQQFCSANGYVIYGSGYQWRPCSPYWSLPWFVWALIVAFLALTALAYARKQIHNYRASLWSLAAVTCALSCLICFMTYSPLDYITDAKLAARYRATLAGFAIYTGATLLLIVLGDALYRLKRVEGADGFVSFKRPAAWGQDEAPSPTAPCQPLRPIEWAFLASVALAAAGTAIALGGLASAQALCNQGGQQGNFMGIQEDCAVFLSWPWFGWALQVAVLGAVLAAWTTANIHSYKQSLWALAAVVIFTACHAGNKLFIMQPYSTGTLHQRQIVALWGFIILIAGDYLMTISLDAVHMLRREEGADGYLTFKRPNWPAPPAKAAAAGEPAAAV